MSVVGMPVAHAQQQVQQLQSQEFAANLTGDSEVPPVTTNATGTADLDLNEARDQMSFDIEVEDIVGATQAHIHQGSESENGDPVVWLFNSTEPTDEEDGTLESGDFTAEDFVGPLQGQNMSDLVELMDDGQAYVNVHTEANPGGEIRGTPEVTLAAAPDVAGGEEDTTDDEDDDTTDDEDEE
jgi:hypothetical protein